MLILDELYQGRKFYREKINNNKYVLDKGILITKYLIHLGMNRYEIESVLYMKINKVYKKIVEEKEIRNKIKYIIDKAIEEGQPIHHTAPFNESELDLIKSQNGINTQILMMTMMVIYKYNGGEFNASVMDLQRVSGIKISSAKFNTLFHNFMKLGYFNKYTKLEYKYGTGRYLTYYKPSDELLRYTKMGSFILQFDDFRNIWIRIHKYLGIKMNTINCKYCGAIEVDKSKGNVRVVCNECKIERDRFIEKQWKQKNNWKHPNLKDSTYGYYYYTKKNSEED